MVIKSLTWYDLKNLNNLKKNEIVSDAHKTIHHSPIPIKIKNNNFKFNYTLIVIIIFIVIVGILIYKELTKKKEDELDENYDNQPWP